MPSARAELERLGHGRDAEGGRAGAERRAGHVDRTVPVAVRLDDRPELRSVEGGEQCPGVPPDRAQVDRELGARHQSGSYGRKFRASSDT